VEAVVGNDTIDHAILDFAEELYAVSFSADGTDPAFEFEKLGVDQNRLVDALQDKHAGLPERAAAPGYLEQRAVKLCADLDDLHRADDDTLVTVMAPGKGWLLGSQKLGQRESDPAGTPGGRIGHPNIPVSLISWGIRRQWLATISVRSEAALAWSNERPTGLSCGNCENAFSSRCI